MIRKIKSYIVVIVACTSCNKEYRVSEEEKLPEVCECGIGTEQVTAIDLPF